MSLTELGEALGRYLDRPWSRQAVHQAERGQRSFTAAELTALALALDTSVPRAVPRRARTDRAARRGRLARGLPGDPAEQGAGHAARRGGGADRGPARHRRGPRPPGPGPPGPHRPRSRPGRRPRPVTPPRLAYRGAGAGRVSGGLPMRRRGRGG
ncbi:hypothetical protein [Nonomuraea rubra]|uniref:hypothetical protein n=1 Tax=Nonomuraea rubra TaxID=46180 RepID=UPI003CD07926